MGERDINVRAPLFDRLIEGEEGARSRTLDRGGLKESVRRELERLFNTRSSLPAAELEARPRTVIDYGIPDFSHLSPQNPEDRARLVATLTKAVEAYEPRLRHVRIKIEDMNWEEHSMRILMEAELVEDPVGETISFESLVPLKRGTARVYGRD